MDADHNARAKEAASLVWVERVAVRQRLGLCAICEAPLRVVKSWSCQACGRAALVTARVMGAPMGVGVGAPRAWVQADLPWGMELVGPALVMRDGQHVTWDVRSKCCNADVDPPRVTCSEKCHDVFMAAWARREGARSGVVCQPAPDGGGFVRVPVQDLVEGRVATVRPRQRYETCTKPHPHDND